MAVLQLKRIDINKRAYSSINYYVVVATRVNVSHARNITQKSDELKQINENIKIFSNFPKLRHHVKIISLFMTLWISLHIPSCQSYTEDHVPHFILNPAGRKLLVPVPFSTSPSRAALTLVLELRLAGTIVRARGRQRSGGGGRDEWARPPPSRPLH